MFNEVTVRPRKFSDYMAVIDPTLYEEVLDLAARLKGARILEVNATAHGGGVAEILHSAIALLQDLKIDTHWQTIKGNDDFFIVTKMLHNALQGDKLTPSQQQWQTYEAVNQSLAKALKPDDWDFILIHDPQPLALRSFLGQSEAKWAWRCHIDTSFPNQQVEERIVGYLKPYDGAVFTMKQYVMPGLKGSNLAKHLAIIPVAIDPLSDKNQEIDRQEARKLVEGIGVDTTRPLIAQISRFDPWKDPLGVVEAWQLAAKRVPGLQLVLMGSLADDDPEGAQILKMVRKAVDGQKDIYVITETNDHLVDALQQAATVVLQKSLREGFGLTVSEALWAGTPVIGGDVGGIPLQVINGQTGYLVMNVQEAAERIVELVQNPERAKQMGLAGREHVRQNFLLPRLMRDQLKFWLSL